MKFSLCIPMYNETSVIEATARTLNDYMQKNFDDYEIIFSDDGSRDGSAELVRSLGLQNVRVVGYEQNRGKGCAVRTGILAATGDVVMFTDADLAYGTGVIREVADIFANKPTDVVIGSRNLHPDGYARLSRQRRRRTFSAGARPMALLLTLRSSSGRRSSATASPSCL